MTPYPSTPVRRLLVVVPGLRGKAVQWEDFKSVAQAQPGHAQDEWLFYEHGATPFSREGVAVLAQRLRDRIRNKAEVQGLPDEILLLGHSLGGLIVREAYLAAVDATYEGEEVDAWARKVTRIILFAAPNQGVVVPGAKLFGVVPFLGLARWLSPLLDDTVQGADFISNLKIGWLRYFRRTPPSQQPVVLQLLGDADSIVDESESLEVEQLPTGEQRRLSGATHNNVHRWDWLPAGNEREEYKRMLMYYTFEHLPSDAPSPKQAERNAVQNVVFVMPGIRALNPDWTTQLRDVLKQPDTDVRIGNYGYFSAAKFLRSGVRRANTRWFKNSYSDALAQYPNANFHFVGHSNGTYILGESLRRLPNMRFQRVYLAGTVLPVDYPWGDLFKKRQVETLRNDKSCADWPVGILCRVMNKVLGIRDVGTGGIDGFQGAYNGKQVQEYAYFAGGHGAPLEAGNHRSISQYINNADPNEPDRTAFVGEISPAVNWGGRLAPALVVLLLAAAAMWVGWGLVTGATPAERFGPLTTVLAATIVGYFALDKV
ncbi:hypothetical protein JAO73_08240 [Hymenobacter sp. BT523]|uniref:alpha/beta hydrolase n=1 Tax=Hymenobacter sp. BT523 TaxID=2795725 RepID=UPI0018EBCF4B|nr:hypothetical protein [Hymenobacter sp. BT523]MBJ6108995.1 hypothetical protein [Hymenobacter sp. BT523]